MGLLMMLHGKILALVMRPHECLDGYFEMMKLIILKYGLPVSLYSDRHTIFFSPKLNKISYEDVSNGKEITLTNFGKAMDALGIEMIPSYSPQAKGRIERLWATLQDRLYNFFKVKDINSIDEANNILPSFIKDYNKKFAVEPKSTKKLFSKINKSLDLDNYLCIRQIRTVDNANSISVFNNKYTICGIQIPDKTKVTVLINPAFGFRILYNNKIFELKIHEKDIKTSKSTITTKTSNKYSPPNDSYHKYGTKLITCNTYQVDLNRIYELFEVDIKSESYFKVFQSSIE